MTKSTIASCLVGTVLLPVLAIAGPATYVENNKNGGPGSLRFALENGATEIIIKPDVGTIKLKSPLWYNFTAPVTIKGSGQTIEGFGLGDASMLNVTKGASLKISDLTFDAGGPWERLVNEGGGKAIYVDVPATASGVVELHLDTVTVLGTGNHGVHVSDCLLETEDGGDDPDACGDGNSGEGDGSNASVHIYLRDVLVQESGFGAQDADGIRVDERGYGDVRLFARYSVLDRVGADGIELDEGGHGDVVIDVEHLMFTQNGEYCLINEFIPGDACDDDGDPDVDDGFDIDEAGPGSILGVVRNSSVIENYDEGLDFDEAGMGGTDLKFVDITSVDNADEGIKVSEEDDGLNVARLNRVHETGDLEFEEEGTGSIRVVMFNSWVGDDFKFVEENAGTTNIRIHDSSIADELEIEAVDSTTEPFDAYLRQRATTIGEIDLVDGTTLQEF